MYTAKDYKTKNKTEFLSIFLNSYCKSIELIKLNDHEDIGVLLTESALESEHKSSISMVSQIKNTNENDFKIDD